MTVLAADTSKALMKIATVQVLADHIKNIRTPIAILLLVTLVPDSLQLFKIGLDTLEIHTLPRIARGIGLCGCKTDSMHVSPL